MNPETRAFLDVVRDAEDPTREDEERVLAAVRATVAVGTLAGALVTSQKLWNALATTWSIPSVKLASAAALLLAGAGPAAAPPSGSVGDERSAGVTAARTVAFTPLRGDVASEPRTLGSPAPSPRATPVPERPVRAKPRDAKGSTVPSHPAPAALGAELALLADVQEARRRGDADEALRLLDEHRTVDTQLLDERVVARILSLCSLGRADEARSLATSFLRDHPASVHRRTVEGSCVGRSSPDDR